ncbi:MAG: endonuclease/exonuclease/phosphatase family protein [Fimbriimonadaceae bacterium]
MLAAAALYLVLASGKADSVPWEIAERPEGAVRVMVWNVLRGGNEVEDGPDKALEIIRAADPDVVLLQESYDIEDDRPQLGIWMAEELGWHTYQGSSPHLNVLSRWEPSETYFHADWHGLGARFEPEGHEPFVAYSIWIDWRAYTPYKLRDEPEATDAELLACETEESSRYRQARAILAHLRTVGHLEAEVPLLVGGDWNCPSHLDWTAETEAAIPFRRNLPLPVSRALYSAGFSDAFRLIHPDPVAVPGDTWSPMYWALDIPEPMDRIDRLYVKNPEAGGYVPVQAFTLPQPYEDPSVAQADRLFPSDHSAVVVDLVWHF